MKTTTRRRYVGQAVFTHSSAAMGQPFGRARLMPSEAVTRRQLSRWHATQRVTASQALSAAALRLVTFSRKRQQRRQVGSEVSSNDFLTTQS